LFFTDQGECYQVIQTGNKTDEKVLASNEDLGIVYILCLD
jgi:hypothetical protein